MAENPLAKDQDQLSDKELDVVAGGADSDDSGIEATDTSMSPFGDIPIGLGEELAEDVPLPDSPPAEEPPAEEPPAPEEASDDSSGEGGVPIVGEVVNEITDDEEGGVPIVGEVVNEITDDEEGGVPLI